ncbi:MAG: FAD-binding protein [Propionibacteriales bacterium]|nr:FAD-binding protein [Propionibacteriales bacterium]
MTSRPTNWAGNITFGAERVQSPTSLERLQDLVAGSHHIRPLGTGHSFNRIADSAGDLVSVAALPPQCVVDHERSAVTVSAGMQYGALAALLHEAGYALPNLGSLPHISIAGAIATGTHGSGSTVGNLAKAVAALQMVTAGGELVETSRETDADQFCGAVVGLGALGVVTQVTLDVVPTFAVAQWVYDDLPRAAMADHIEEIFSSAYSVSLFTTWRDASFHQVWRKHRREGSSAWEPPRRWLGATLADAPRHPIAGMPATRCTEQLGAPGPWHARLPHFRMDHTPSSGRELQSEYLLPRRHAVDALAAIESIRHVVAPLVQVSEIRTVARDDLWLSPSYQRDSIAIHFTWVPDIAAVTPVLGAVEEQLEPFSPRPHWGKLFTTSPQTLCRQYKRYADFTTLMRRYDPTGKFRNELLDSWFPPGAAPQSRPSPEEGHGVEHLANQRRGAADQTRT